jgi:hypothetical protein
MIQFVNTPLLDELPPLVKDFLGEHFGFLEMEKVTAGKYLHHACLFISFSWKFNLQNYVKFSWS